MNPFKSLAQAIRNALDFGKKETEVPAPPPARKPYRSAFGGGASGDGFEGRARTRPVDLSGGVKLKYEVPEEPVAPPPPEQSDFVASLDDLGTLVEEQAADQPAPPSGDTPPPQSFELQPYGPPPQDAFEPAAPVDAFEELPSAEAEPLDSFEPASPFAAEPAAAVAESPREAEPAVAAEAPGAAEPAKSPAPPAAVEQKVAPPAPQHTVALLMPVGLERPPRAEAAEQFSTLELLDTIAQLLPPELAEQTPQSPALEPPPVVEQSPVVEAPPAAEPPPVAEPPAAAVEPPSLAGPQPASAEPPSAPTSATSSGARSDPAPE